MDDDEDGMSAAAVIDHFNDPRNVHCFKVSVVFEARVERIVAYSQARWPSVPRDERIGTAESPNLEERGPAVLGGIIRDSLLEIDGHSFARHRSAGVAPSILRPFKQENQENLVPQIDATQGFLVGVTGFEPATF
ncbi:MAG: hypothetical protein HYS13_07345 [Planctomycetia bacterium]|nr:hypothetical protein [Planctomycetia bacterium]